ncbi:MAG TPA: succinylglutamate desuccinylase/aspartoacylase family protein [Candidatus Saccharimonadales bacterium]|nr:succinylglutamate desuccinylase/aspartoacylase family protein [Candidatus Saccharimonadales bacterium]
MRNILFIAATHGNEEFSIPVLERLGEQYPKAEYGYDWVVGNPRALEAGVRYTEKDLNRSAPGDKDSPYYEERRAAELVELSHDYDVVIDLHGSVADCGVVTLIPLPTRANIQLARSIPLERNVIWYSEKSQTAGPTVQHAACAALEIECGLKAEPATAEKLYKVLAQIVTANAAGTFFDEPTTMGQEFYEVYGVIEGEQDPGISDSAEATVDGETFMPFMANQYAGTLCYKMKRINQDEIDYKG